MGEDSIMNNLEALSKMEVEEDTGQLCNKITPKYIRPSMTSFEYEPWEPIAPVRRYSGIELEIDGNILAPADKILITDTIQDLYANHPIEMLTKYIDNLAIIGIWIRLSVSRYSDKYEELGSPYPSYVYRR
jgi:hypothetical protein